MNFLFTFLSKNLLNVRGCFAGVFHFLLHYPYLSQLQFSYSHIQKRCVRFTPMLIMYTMHTALDREGASSSPT